MIDLRRGWAVAGASSIRVGDTLPISAFADYFARGGCSCGTSASTREAWRLCLFSVLSPLGKLVEAELQDKLEDTVTLSWQELRASDLSGRARAFQSMVGGGMEVERAAGLAGLTGVA